MESIVLLIHVQTSGREEALWSKRCVILCVCVCGGLAQLGEV